jgi:cytochrome c peroxidase
MFLRRRMYGVLGCLLGGTLALFAPPCGAQATKSEGTAKASTPSGGGTAPHGALPMSEQQAALSRLRVGDTQVVIPRGVDPAFFSVLLPKDNPGTLAQVELGRKLFFDTRLSKDGTVACATCHDTSRGFGDHRAMSEGIGDQIGKRNAPTTMNALFFQTQFWDGRATTLEDQAQLPIINPIEMGMPDGKAAVAAIAEDTEYQQRFMAAYGRQPNFDDLARAIAAFERTQVFLDAPFDRFLGGDVKAVSDDAVAGWLLFNGKGRCSACHQMNASSPIGTDNRFHNVGVSARHRDFEGLVSKALGALAKSDSQETIDRLALETDLAELGRFVVTRNRSDIGSFKTQQVRNVGITAPYMHDGSMATLWDVMDHYNKGGEPNPFLDGGMEILNLTEKEIDQMVAFLFSLTDGRFAQKNQAEFARQRTLAGQRRPFRNEAMSQRRVLPFEAKLQQKR